MTRIEISYWSVFIAVALFIVAGSPAASAETAADNYSLYCVQCHGTKGTGKGVNAPYLAVAPRNHSSAKDMSQLKDPDIFKAIKSGGVSVGKSTQMPTFGGILTDSEITDMVKHLHKMCKC